jgi:hypothetical protein
MDFGGTLCSLRSDAHNCLMNSKILVDNIKIDERYYPLGCNSGFLLVTCLDYSSTLKRKALRSSETSVNFYRITRCYIPEDSTLQSPLWEPQIQRWNNLKQTYTYIKMLNKLNWLKRGASGVFWDYHDDGHFSISGYSLTSGLTDQLSASQERPSNHRVKVHSFMSPKHGVSSLITLQVGEIASRYGDRGVRSSARGRGVERRPRPKSESQIFCLQAAQNYL